MGEKEKNRILCKKCGKDITWNHDLACLKNKKILDTLPTDIAKIYEGFAYAPSCPQCYEIIDYKELELDSFWEWLKYASKGIKDSKLKGRAVIRYFGLLDLLQQNTN